MFVTDEWTHLAMNLGTSVEGSRTTKTLTAYVNCSRVWDVGLYIDKNDKQHKNGKKVSVTLGPGEEEGLVYFGDVHLLKETCLTVEHIVLDYILGPWTKSYKPKIINYKSLLQVRLC